MLKIFVSILSLGLLLSTYAGAQSPIGEQIKDPVFLKISSLYSGNIENQNRISLDFYANKTLCYAQYGKNYYTPCRPRLNMEGQKAVSGLTITPAIKGEWHWDNDYRLTFTPSDYWLTSQNYVIDIDLDKLNVSERVFFQSTNRKTAISIKSQSLKIKTNNMKYMQDPNDPKRKFVTANLKMNYPVVQDTLKQRLTLKIAEKTGKNITEIGKTLPYELQIQANQISADISIPVEILPNQDRYLKLNISAGVQPKFGGQISDKIFKERVRIPSLKNYLNLNSASTTIARTEDGTPQQMLSLGLNVKALPTELRRKTKLYLLPFDHPVMKRSAQSKGSNAPYKWKASNEVTPSVLEKSELLPLNFMTDYSEYVTQFGFNFKANAGRYLYLSVEDGLEAFGGYSLENKYEKILNVPAYPNDIKIMQDGCILTLSGTHKLSLHSRGTDKLQVEVAQILPEALAHFISQTQGNITNPSFKTWSFDKSDIARIDSRDVVMSYKSPHASQYASFDFGSYLKDERKGIFLLNIQGFKDDKHVGNKVQRFVLVTDMGLLIKHNANNSSEVFLTSFQNGRPINIADISVLGNNGLQIFTGKTDEDGHISLPDFSGFSQDRRPVAIVAQKGDDYAFIPYDRHDRLLNTSRFNVGGTRIAPEGLNAFLFSDRGIYRPGETAHIGLIVENADWETLPPVLPLKLTITDPRGRVTQENIINFSASSLEEITLETGQSWQTGTYAINLYISNDGNAGNWLGGTSIRVEEFMPDRLKIKNNFLQNDIEIDKEEGWSKPKNLIADVTLTNLYGTVASDRQIKAKILLTPAHLKFKKYPDYRFYDSYPAKPRNIYYVLPTMRTDKDGHADIDLNLSNQEIATYNLNLETTGYEAGSGKGVTSYNTTLISPMDYVIGYHSKANLGYLKQEKYYHFMLKALDENLSPVNVQDLKLTLVQKNYVSTLVKRGDGSYVYESIPKEKDIQTTDLSIRKIGQPVLLPTDELGDYIYRLKNKDGLIIANIPFSIAGEGQISGGTDRETVLKIKTNKSDYVFGEKIEINISAPYTGAGLITLESDHVLNYKWFRTNKTETVQSIDIPKDFSGKGYVNVAFIRNVNSNKIYLSPLSNAIVPFTANIDRRRISINLDVPETAVSGENFTIKYTGNKKGKAILFAVDEGILQVAKYKTPNPVEHFLLNRALQVQTSQMLDLLMPEYALIRKLSAKGGGADGEDAALGKHLNPFGRKILAPAVYWSGIVDLDTTEKTLTFTPPSHFNGQLRVMAVAVGHGNVGSTDQDMIVRSDIVITPNLPIFLAPNDEAEVSITIANGLEKSGTDAEISIQLEPSKGINIIQAPPKTIKIPEGEEKSISFKIKATDTLGAANLIIHTNIGDVKQDAEATLSIRPPVALETTMMAGYAKNGEAVIDLKRKLYEEFAEKDLSVSALPTAYIHGLLRYLDGFPYGCTEQITSRIYPQLSLMGFEEFSISQTKMTKNVNDVVSTLRRRQTQNGGFSLWNGGYQSDDFISVYAFDFLTEARNKNLPVPSDMVNKSNRHLRNWVNQSITSMNDARNKAYAIYILTRNGMVTSNEILHWLQYFKNKKTDTWKTDLSAVYIAASYEMMQQKNLAKKLMDRFENSTLTSEISYKNTDWNNPYYSPFIKYSQYVSILSRHFPERFKKMDRNIVFKLADFIQTNRYNTLSASYAIQALSDYTAQQDKILEQSKITVSAGGEVLSLSNGKTGLDFDMSHLEIKDSGQPLFYTVTETGYNSDNQDHPITNGLEIERAYTTDKGQPIEGTKKTVTMGDIIIATIKVRSHEGRRVENVAIIDLLPAGFAFEPENSDDTATLTPEFVDRREDRIIIFTDIAPHEQVFRYRLRAVSKGTFQVPPPYAESMYDLTKKAKGHTGRITVQDEVQ